jgi:hypothetical protein
MIMTRQRLHTSVASVLLLPLLISAQGCGEPNSFQAVSVSLTNTETYQYPTVGGDEEGARISTQPNHSSISEIRRDAATNWVAVYVYRPAAGFVGSDYAEVEIMTGSDGASAPTSVKRVAFHFVIHD